MEHYNATSHPIEGSQHLGKLFEEQVLLRGDSIALSYGGRSLSYREVESETNRFGHYLRERYGLLPGALVGVKLERSEWMVLVLLSIVRQGCAYVPIDVRYPQERVNYMVSDSGMSCLIGLPELDEYRSVRERYSSAGNQVELSSNDLAYVIYTCLLYTSPSPRD